MESLRIGHYTDEEHATGLTVFLLDPFAKAAYCVAGSAPATREIAVLDLSATVDHLDALVFSGGSAFGLGAADGVLRYLAEKNQGKFMPHGGVVPIVVGASLYDLAVKKAAYPTPIDAYSACLSAKQDENRQGRIGAGTGASVGKLLKQGRAMTGGLGIAEVHLSHGVVVKAYAVVNAVGDIRDANQQIIAGARSKEGNYLDTRAALLSGEVEANLSENNTTLVAIFTNAALSKVALHRIAKMTLSGFSLAISPVFTPYDGDIVFCVSIGDKKTSEFVIGTAAVEAVRGAIVNAVKDSTILS